MDDATLASSGTDAVKHGSSVVDSPIPNQDQNLPLAMRGIPPQITFPCACSHGRYTRSS